MICRRRSIEVAAIAEKGLSVRPDKHETFKEDMMISGKYIIRHGRTTGLIRMTEEELQYSG